MDCPKCLGKLQKTTISMVETSSMKELEGAALSYNLEVDRCFACSGVWFDRGELDKYLTEGITTVDSPSAGADLDMAFDKKPGKCPKCKILMDKKQFSSKPKTIIDVCPKCQGIWLDSTELDRLEANNPKKPKETFSEKIASYVANVLTRRNKINQ